MATLIASIVFLFSLGGAGAIAYRKLPLLIDLPDVAEEGKKDEIILAVKNRVQNMSFIKNFSYEIFLQKILSKFRVLTLKTENKTSNWLQELREKRKKKKIIEDDNYWDEIKKK